MSRTIALLAPGLLVGWAALTIAAPVPQRSDAVAAGKALFNRCIACHGSTGAGNALGPDIRAIIGRSAAAQPDFAYSVALRRSRKTWTEAELAAYLLKPQAAVPGTRMNYAGAGSPEKAAALAAYVATLR